MSTRDELFAAMSTAIALRQGTVYVSEDGKTPVLHLDWIADYLLAQGWRPPVRTVTTVEELDGTERGTDGFGATGGIAGPHERFGSVEAR